MHFGFLVMNARDLVNISNIEVNTHGTQTYTQDPER